MAPKKKQPQEKQQQRERTRVHRVLLALTDEELSQLEALAAEKGLGLGVYARVRLFEALKANP